MTSIPRSLPLLAGDVPNRSLLQITDIGRHRLYLRLGEAVRHRAHDRRGVRLGRILSAFLAPIHQLLDDVGIELPGQPRNLPAAGGLRPVTGGACRDIGVGNAVLENLSSRGDELHGRAANWLGIEAPEM